MRGISRQVLARDMAWTLADGACKDRAHDWTDWEQTYAAGRSRQAWVAALVEPAAVCAGCPITTECADLAELTGYTGIAAGRAFRNGRTDTYRSPPPHNAETA